MLAGVLPQASAAPRRSWRRSSAAAAGC